jgi:hypothetical protein
VLPCTEVVARPYCAETLRACIEGPSEDEWTPGRICTGSGSLVSIVSL